MLLVKNGYIKPMVGEDIPCGSVLIGDDGKITAVGTGALCTIVDGKVVYEA